jgi:hypothetical protein
VSAPGDYDNGEIGGTIGRGNRSTRKKPAPVPLCPPQTPHAARMRNRAATVGSQRLTAELRYGHPSAIVRLQRLGKLKKSNDLIGKQTQGLPACSIASQLRYGVLLNNIITLYFEGTFFFVSLIISV